MIAPSKQKAYSEATFSQKGMQSQFSRFDYQRAEPDKSVSERQESIERFPRMDKTYRARDRASSVYITH